VTFCNGRLACSFTLAGHDEQEDRFILQVRKFTRIESMSQTGGLHVQEYRRQDRKAMGAIVKPTHEQLFLKTQLWARAHCTSGVGQLGQSNLC